MSESVARATKNQLQHATPVLKTGVKRPDGWELNARDGSGGGLGAATLLLLGIASLATAAVLWGVVGWQANRRPTS